MNEYRLGAGSESLLLDDEAIIGGRHVGAYFVADLLQSVDL